jgi:preprotein translocase subunit SecG
MGFIDFFLELMGMMPSQGVSSSMPKSKTLTVMTIVGVVFFTAFALFLVYMAGGFD